MGVRHAIEVDVLVVIKGLYFKDFSAFVKIQVWSIGMVHVSVGKERIILLNNALCVPWNVVLARYSLMIYYALVAMRIWID